MSRRKAVSHFVAVSDLSQPATEQEGILIEVVGRGGDTPQNREKALEIIQKMWERGEIEEDKFPDGMTQENIFFVSPESPRLQETEPDNETLELPSIVKGAQEIIQLTRLQLEVQEAAEEASPYVPIIQAVLEKTRPLSAEEKDLARDKKYGKTIERLGMAVAEQEEYREQCTGDSTLILNAIAWQLNQGVNPSIEKQNVPKKGDK